MVRINKMLIEGFRGIAKPLTLDLTAPLTVIYAPNGVGKTSICDAAEWLLTNTVRRLVVGKSLSEELRCQYVGNEVATRVFGDITLGEQNVTVEKVFSEGVTEILWANKGATQSALSLSSSLERLAPNAVDPNAHKQHANVSRQEWLRGTRFLSVESLAPLLDTDEQSVKRRQRLFADLLGVGFLLEDERQLRNYIDTLRPSASAQRRSTEEKRRELADKLKQAGESADSVREQLMPELSAMLSEVRSLLELGAKLGDLDQAALRKEAITARAELERREAELSSRRRAEIALATEWDLRASLNEQLVRDQASAVRLSEDLVKHDAMISSASASMQNIVTIFRSLDEVRKESVERLGPLESAGAAFSRANAAYKQRVAGWLSNFGTLQTVAKAAGSEATRAASISKSQAIVNELSERLQERKDLETLLTEIAKQREDARRHDSDGLTKKAREASADLAVLRDQFDQLSAPLEQLRSIAFGVVQSNPDESACPVCNHDWKSHDKLSAALHAAAATIPENIRLFPTKIANAEKLLNESQRSLALLSSLHTAISANDKKATELRRRQQGFRERLAELGLSADSATLKNDAEVLLLRLQLLEAFRRLFREVDLCGSIVDFKITEDLPTGSIASIILEKLNAKIADCEQQLSELQGQSLGVDQQLTGLRSERQVRDAELNATNKRILSTSHKLQQLRDQWARIGGKAEWTNENLEKARRRLQDDEAKLSKAQSFLIAFDNLVSASVLADELSDLRASLKSLEDEARRLEAYLDAATQVENAYRETRYKHTREQMSSFVQVISALFIRMQATEVYERITEGDEAAPLSWKAISDDFGADPDRRFSQGQKQDFALAVFLARARGLSGTFFLDEPLAHLDDLNRVALLDVLRAICLEGNEQLSLVLTTASKPVVRHLAEKFQLLNQSAANGKLPFMRVFSLIGNPRSGVSTADFSL